MDSGLAGFFKRSVAKFSHSRRPQLTLRQLRCEPLEARRLLSVAGTDGALELFHAQDALFAENAGQWAGDEVYFGYNKGGTQIYFTDDALQFGLSRRELKEGVEAEDLDRLTPGEEEEAYDYLSTHFSLQFDGAEATVPVGADRAETVFNYHLGEQTNWVDGVATYKTVVYEGLYDGIDLHTFSRHGQMKYEFHVAPGSDYSQIALGYEGIEGLSIDEDGSLRVMTELGEIVDEDLYVYQVIDGQEVEVAGEFTLLDNDSYTFSVTGAYDPSVELVIDPELDWSTYLGGSSDDHGYGIAVDASGSVLVTGRTRSSGWTSGGYDTSYNGGDFDAFVVKLSPSGSHLWSTYLGGSSHDGGFGIAADASGNVLVTGYTYYTYSSGWTSGGYDTIHNGRDDAFVVKLSPSGSHLWSTYLGGSEYESGRGIAVDDSGNVLVTGWTNSSGWTSGGYDTSYNGGGSLSGDAFVVKFSSSGSHLWSTYLGGNDWDEGRDIAADASGNVLVTGYTGSSGWTSGGYDTSWSGDRDAFVVKLSPSGGHLWSTYLGGNGGDEGHGIAADASGNVLVTGRTFSPGWTSGGYDTSHNGSSDAFVVKLSPSGGHLWSTYLGGSDIDFGYGIVVDASGNVLVTGYTDSAGWTSGGYDTSFNGDADVFVVKLSPSGSHLWSTYLGGSTSDAGLGIAVDASGNVLVAGTTNSPDWTSGGYDTSYNGDNDAFVAKIGSTVGDLNGDGFVGGDDLDLVRANWGQNVTAGDLLAGDPSGDGFVGGDDLDIVRANWGQGTPPVPVAMDTSDAATEPIAEEKTLEAIVQGPRLPEVKDHRRATILGPRLAEAHDEAILDLLPETKFNQNALLKLAWAHEFEQMRLRRHWLRQCPCCP